jgi:hypothetical protein
MFIKKLKINRPLLPQIVNFYFCPPICSSFMVVSLTYSEQLLE